MGLEALHRGLVIAAALAGPGFTNSAFAGGMYFKEIRKDGRIYVFNDPHSADMFEESGEPGRSLIRIGVGPDGETVVADSEDALEPLFFRNGIAETVDKPKKPKLEVSWKDGKTTIATDQAELKLSNRVQVRFTEQIPADATQLSGTGAPGDSKGSFRIRRAKTKFEGWFYDKSLSYEVQLNWAALGGSEPGAALEDANINWEVSRSGAFQIKLGQYKVPFGRQELTSSGSQQFVDRSITSNEFAKGRDTGLQIWGLLARNRIEWRAGIFNGNGITRSANDNDEYQLNARLQLQPNGDPKYSESDLDSKDKLLWSIAGDFEQNDFGNVASDPTKNLKRTIYGIDGIFKYKGFSFFGEVFFRKLQPQNGAKYDSNGYHLQAGYLLDRARRWEVALRYASWDPTDAVSGNDRNEIGGAVSYFYNKHNLKVQADLRQLEDKARGTKDKEVRLQTQFIF